MTQIEDEKIYDLADIYFNFGTDNIRLISQEGVTVTYKIDTNDINDVSSYYRIGTTIKSVSIDVEIKSIVNINRVREAVAKSISNRDTEISIGVYNKEPGKTPVIEDVLYGVAPSELKIEKKEGNTCDLKGSASYSKIFNPN